MPNHVHVLFTIRQPFSLASIVHSWKSFTSKQANRLLKRTGRFWQPEYFERLIKSERQFEFSLRYILNNRLKLDCVKIHFNSHGPGCSGEMEKLLNRFF